MLTIKPVGKASDALHYYSSKDNYYLTDKETLLESSYWIGKGASKLNLSGVVEPQAFLPLLNGELPNGERLGILKNGQWEHRAGTDVTLSAPKSVSILALVGQDKRLIDAHKKAVAMTFDRIEALAAEARLTFKGQTVFEKTNNLTAATFLHTSSRALDPDLHTHMVILNMTERLDGMWRALSSRQKADMEHLFHGFRELIYQNQHYLGLVYMSTLAKEVKQLGFDIRIKDIYGNFEIEGVSDEVIQHLSKRRNEIEKDMEEKGTKTARAAEVSNKATRQKKADIDSKALFEKWLNDIEGMDVDLNALIQESEEKKAKGDLGETNPHSKAVISQTAKEAVSDALSHLSEFNTEIKHSTLVRQAFSFAAGTISHDEIEQQITDLLDEKALEGKPLEYYTTKGLLQKEKDFVETMTAKKNASFDIKTEHTGLAATLLKKNSKVEIIDVNGDSNQKSLIQDMVDIAEGNGVNAYVLHQSRHHSQLLSDEVKRGHTGLFSWFKNLFKDDIVHTVAGFKYRYGNDLNKSDKQSLIVVNDAQKLSLGDLTALKAITDRNQGKLVLLNNTQSTLGFSPGNPIKTLKENGIDSTVFIGARNDIPVELSVAKQPVLSMVSQWIEKEPGDKEPVTMVALTNQQAEDITKKVRTALKQQGVLSSQSKEAPVLSTQGLTDAQKKHPRFYKAGDRITFKAFTKEQKHYEVIASQGDSLVLQNEAGKQSLFQPTRVSEFEVSRAKDMEFCIGDRLTNDRAFFIRRLKIEKGSAFEVSRIEKEGVEFVSDAGKIYLDNDTLKKSYLSYNYCKKPGQLGKDDRHVSFAPMPYQLNKNIMGEMTRYAKKVSLFTGNKTKAENYLDKEQLKWSATDIAEKKPDLVYRDIRHADKAIEKDIKALIDALEFKKDLNKNEIARLAVSYAVAKCAEREAAFKHSDLLTHALKFSLGKADFEDIAPVLKERMESGDLMFMGTYWTTKEALSLEENIIKTSFKEQGTVVPIEKNANNLLDLPERMTQGQKDAVTLSVTASDRFVSVQGLAGTGKTTMMNKINEIAVKHGFRVLGLAPTHQSKDELNATDIESMTVEGFLTHNVPINEKTLLIVDETSMLGNAVYHELQNRAIMAQSRVIFAGDITQQQSLASGIPHELTIKSGSQKAAFMTEILRQNPNPTLKKAAEKASVRDIAGAFSELEKINPEEYVERKNNVLTPNTSSVIEVNCDTHEGEKNYEPIYEAIARDFLSRTKECQQETIVIAHAHQDRAVIDRKIRQGLQAQGDISQHEKTFERLVAKSKDKADLINLSNFSEFKPGDILRFGKTYHVGKRGEYFTVQGINQDKNELICLTEDNLTVNVKATTLIKGAVSVYERYQCALATGDKIRLKLSDEERGFVANKEYEVLSISDKGAEIKNGDTTLSLNLENKTDQHWDYAYTNTAYSIQGATRKLVIALELLGRIVVTNHRSQEIDITRASHQGTVYTDDKKGLIERLGDFLKQKEADKTSAIIEKQAYLDEKAKTKKVSDALKKARQQKERMGIDTQKTSNEPIKTAHPTPHPKQYRIDANEVHSLLAAQSSQLLHHLLGEPNKSLSSDKEYRYGTKGSLSIKLSEGLWHNFETSEGGNLFTLIQQEKGLSNFKEALDFAVEFTSHHSAYALPKAAESTKEKPVNKPHVGRRSFASQLYRQSRPVKGSIVEKYLTVHRRTLQFENADIKYCPSVFASKQEDINRVFTPALLCFSRNEKGMINHVQVTRLDSTSGDKYRLFEPGKQTFGAINGHAVNLNRKGEGEVTWLTEGVETGLSILEVKPKARVLTVLGKENFDNVNVSQLTKEVVLCVDNDGKGTFAYLKDNTTNKIISAVDRLHEHGIKVSISISKTVGEDLNDILIKQGKEGMKKALNELISPDEFKKMCEKENSPIISEKNKDIEHYRMEDSAIKADLMSKIKSNELMKSSLVQRLKEESMSQSITNLSEINGSSFVQKPKTPDREMEREI